MALVHRAKLTHYFSPSPKHLGTFFRSLTSLYVQQQHTDLLLVAGGGGGGGGGNKTSAAAMEQEEEEQEEEEESNEGGNVAAAVVFGTHQMILASCSTFVRDLILKTTDGCTCDTLTIFLPDYEPKTVKNLLSILYTGTSIGDCSMSELKSLLDTLKIDIRNLSVQSQRDGNKAFPDVELPTPICQESSRSASPLHHRGGGGNIDEDYEDEEEAMNDEMLEIISPEVQMFLGNHFLAGGNGENGGDESDSDESKVNGGGKETNTNMMEQSMARHKEMAKYQQQQQHLENGSDQSTVISNGLHHLHHLQQHQSGVSSDAAASGDDKTYSCRLCGKVSGNGASLFAHLLYPHYAHLWREEVPHRAPRYDCKECNYSTVKRQHFVMHVARVHDELRKKLAALGENLEVLDNLTQKSQNNSGERIISTIAKGVCDESFSTADSDPSTAPAAIPSGLIKDESFEGSPNAKEMFGGLADMSSDDFTSPSKLFAFDQGSAASAGGGRFPRGFKPFVKCRLCGKSWKGKDNFFTHLVSTHFKYLWAKEVPKHADMFHCHVRGCKYQSKYRYNFLFHLAGKHKQLKQKLAEEGIPHNVLIPIESDGSEFNSEMADDVGAAAAASVNAGAALLAGMASGLMNPSEMLRQSKLFLQQQQQQQQQQQRQMTTPPSALKTSKPSTNNTRLICRVCSKVSLNHTCHRQHVVGKHFHEFWAHLTADGMGIFNCHHPDCSYKTPNRSVFIIHLAYVHQELKNKLIQSGKDPTCATPDVYGKRKYRRAYYDNTQHGSSGGIPSLSLPSPGGLDAHMSSLMQQQQQQLLLDQQQASSSSSAAAAAAAAAAMEGGMLPQSHRCTVCKAEFPRQRMAVEHLALSHFHHVWDASSEASLFGVPAKGPFVCQHCPFTSASRQPFICHIVSQHEALKHVLAIQFGGEKTIEDLIESNSAGLPLDAVVAVEDNYEELGEEEEEDVEDEEEEEEEEDEDMNMSSAAPDSGEGSANIATW